MTYGSFMYRKIKTGTYDNVTISHKLYHVPIMFYIVMLPYNISVII